MMKKKNQISRKCNVKLYPTKKQEKFLFDYNFQAKFIWNNVLSYYKWKQEQRKKNINNGILSNKAGGIKKNEDILFVYNWWKENWNTFSSVKQLNNETVLPAAARNHIIGNANVHADGKIIVGQKGMLYSAWEKFFREAKTNRIFPPKFKGHRSNPPELLLIPNDKSFSFFSNKNDNWAVIKLPGIGRVKFRATERFHKLAEHRKIGKGTIGKGVVCYKHGEWILSLTFSTKNKNLFRRGNGKFPNKEVGVDFGVTIPAALSSGEVLGILKSNLDSVNSDNVWNKENWEQYKKKILKYKKQISRFQTFRWKEAKEKLSIIKPDDKLSTIEIGRIKKATRHPSRKEKRIMLKKQRLERKLYNQKTEFRHQISNKVAKSGKNIYIEDLKLRNMSKSAKGTKENPGKNVKAKSGLNRVLLENGLYDIVEKIKYKAEDYGSNLIKVPPQNTSATCIKCGYCHKKNRKRQDTFVCLACGHKENADIHASKNIKAKGKNQEKWEKNRQKATKNYERGLLVK